MSKQNSTLTPEAISSVLLYDGASGELRYKIKVKGYRPGDPTPPGPTVSIFGRSVSSAKVAWMLWTGEAPLGIVRRIDKRLGLQLDNLEDCGAKKVARSTGHVTQERLRRLLKYCPSSGLFSWLVTSGSNSVRGEIAGTTREDGYVRITVDGRQYWAHRLAYFYIYGRMPKVIDHKDRDRSNNALDNLRNVTYSENNQNAGLESACNKSGYKGVFKAKNDKWFARITVDGTTTHLGTFNTPEDAHDAYVAEKQRAHECGMVYRQ